MRLMHGYRDRGHGHGTHAVCAEDGQPLEMTAENVEKIVALWNGAWLSDSGKTHWEGCWRDHYRCAMRRTEELEERIRMLNDIALSAICLKMSIENGFTPNLDALKRDLAAYGMKFKSAVPVSANGDVAQVVEPSTDNREVGSSSDPVTTISEMEKREKR